MACRGLSVNAGQKGTNERPFARIFLEVTLERSFPPSTCLAHQGGPRRFPSTDESAGFLENGHFLEMKSEQRGLVPAARRKKSARWEAVGEPAAGAASEARSLASKCSFSSETRAAWSCGELPRGLAGRGPGHTGAGAAGHAAGKRYCAAISGKEAAEAGELGLQELL